MEHVISSAIVDTYFAKLKKNLSLDVAIVGGGPSGLVAAATLAKAGKKVALFERNLAPGGGMWGGAMLFNQIVIQNEATHILDEYGIRYERYDDDYVTLDSVESTSALIYHATHNGATIFNGCSTEDVVFHHKKVSGVVINWAPVAKLGWHVDPIAIMAKTVLDGTGHPSEIAAILARKNDIKLNTPTGGVIGEMSMCVEEGEKATVEHTSLIYPGLYVSGMAANAVSGTSRMGPIFGGMLLSGKKVAKLILEELA